MSSFAADVRETRGNAATLSFRLFTFVGPNDTRGIAHNHYVFGGRVLGTIRTGMSECSTRKCDVDPNSMRDKTPCPRVPQIIMLTPLSCAVCNNKKKK